MWWRYKYKYKYLFSRAMTCGRDTNTNTYLVEQWHVAEVAVIRESGAVATWSHSLLGHSHSLPNHTMNCTKSAQTALLCWQLLAALATWLLPLSALFTATDTDTWSCTLPLTVVATNHYHPSLLLRCISGCFMHWTGTLCIGCIPG